MAVRLSFDVPIVYSRTCVDVDVDANQVLSNNIRQKGMQCHLQTIHLSKQVRETSRLLFTYMILK